MTRFTALCIFSLAVACSGCAGRGPRAESGNYIQGEFAADTRRIVDDVTHRMVTLYPPARSRLNLQHATPDKFGSTLVIALRAKGYALADFNAKSATNGPANTNGHKLAYLIDQPLDAGSYRVTVTIDSQTLSRVYEIKDGVVEPAGYWVRKE